MKFKKTKIIGLSVFSFLLLASPILAAPTILKINTNHNISENLKINRFLNSQTFLNKNEDLNSGGVSNLYFHAEKIWSKTLFGYQTEGSNSYRIPGILKLPSGRILVHADKRVESIEDYNNTIEQVLKYSDDEGNTWSQNQNIVKVTTLSTNKGLIIDGTFSNVQYPVEGQIKNKIIYLFDIFANREGVHSLMKGNPWVYVDNESYLKLWIKTNGQFEKQNAILKRVDNKAQWWREYKLPLGLNYSDITASTNLIPTNTYVDNSYNSETYSITGQVYENVLPNELNNANLLAKKATKYSIWDNYNSAKYFLSKNNFVGYLESFNQGKSWTNFKMLGSQIANNPYRNEAFFGTGVGNGIQLKFQKDSKMNGRIYFPMYSYTSGIQKPYLIYSDDYGLNWKTKFVSGLKNNLMESSLAETHEGQLYWYLRQAIWGRKNNRATVLKSLDGGNSWINPNNLSTSKSQDINLTGDANNFSGFDSFEINHKNYFVFSMPKIPNRTAGSLYISNDTFTKITEVYSFDKTNTESFAYSTAFVLGVDKNYADLLVAYEWSPKTKIFNYDPHHNNRPKGEGIHLEKIRILIKD